MAEKGFNRRDALSKQHSVLFIAKAGSGYARDPARTQSKVSSPFIIFARLFVTKKPSRFWCSKSPVFVEIEKSCIRR